MTLEMPMGRTKYSTEIEWVAHRLHRRRRIMRHILALTFTWLFIVIIYAVSIRIASNLLQHNMEDIFFCQWDGFWAYYGIGMIVATLLLPMFVIDFLIEDVEVYKKEKALLLLFQSRK